jgi:hypothetical protein
MEQVDDGAANLAGAKDQNFSGHWVPLNCRSAERCGLDIP